MFASRPPEDRAKRIGDVRRVGEIAPSVIGKIHATAIKAGSFAKLVSNAKDDSGLTYILILTRPAKAVIKLSDDATKSAYVNLLYDIVKHPKSNSLIIASIFKDYFSDKPECLSSAEVKLILAIRESRKITEATRSEVNRFISCSKDEKLSEYASSALRQAEFDMAPVRQSYMAQLR